ncbi:MAG: hypothetical protein PHW04_05175 [Candidatus Wallbacteria bacterium]|nr:hypothetical protein [Candidatus Wallbacteria bacterium]
MKKTIALLLLTGVLAFQAAALEMPDRALNRLISEYWQAKNGSEQAYDSACKTADQIAGGIISQLSQNDQSSFRGFNKLYQETVVQAPELREALNLVADRIIESNKAQSIDKDEDFTPDTLFPGYGYPDPEYEYRIGDEISREMLQEITKTEVKCFSTDTTYTALLKAGTSFPAALGVTKKKIGTEIFNQDANPVKMDKYLITFSRSLELTCLTRDMKIRIWFKLFRAKKGWLGNGDFAECGKTYQIQDSEQYILQ